MCCHTNFLRELRLNKSLAVLILRKVFSVLQKVSTKHTLTSYKERDILQKQRKEETDRKLQQQILSQLIKQNQQRLRPAPSQGGKGNGHRHPGGSVPHPPLKGKPSFPANTAPKNPTSPHLRLERQEGQRRREGRRAGVVFTSHSTNRPSLPTHR